MSAAVCLTFSTYEEELTLVKRVEVKAIDLRTRIPLASLSPVEMKAWLIENGFEWRPGSNGIWDQTAADALVLNKEAA